MLAGTFRRLHCAFWAPDARIAAAPRLSPTLGPCSNIKHRKHRGSHVMAEPIDQAVKAGTQRQLLGHHAEISFLWPRRGSRDLNARAAHRARAPRRCLPRPRSGRARLARFSCEGLGTQSPTTSGQVPLDLPPSALPPHTHGGPYTPPNPAPASAVPPPKALVPPLAQHGFLGRPGERRQLCCRDVSATPLVRPQRASTPVCASVPLSTAMRPFP